MCFVIVFRHKVATKFRAVRERETMVSFVQTAVCVLNKQQHGADVFNVRVFVLERLSAAAKFMCDCNIYSGVIVCAAAAAVAHGCLLQLFNGKCYLKKLQMFCFAHFEKIIIWCCMVEEYNSLVIMV